MGCEMGPKTVVVPFPPTLVRPHLCAVFALLLATCLFSDASENDGHLEFEVGL
jgi:hypothetical protein